MKLSPQELEKVRKAAILSVTLSSEMKATVVESRLKELTQDIKKLLTKKNAVLDVISFKIDG